MPKIKSRPARIATSARNASHNEAGGQSVAGREKTKKQPKEDLRKTKEELSIQKWGLEKTLGGMKALVKEIIQKEKELKETNKKLEQVDQAKSEFISLASHQLKTPPTAIKVLTERLLGGKMGKFTEKQKEYLSDICFSNQRMIDIVNTLLDVSRIELGALVIQTSEKDVCVIVQSVLDELNPLIDKKQLKLKIIFPDKSVRLMLDEPLFRMVISNLITNAISYTAPGGEIQVECRVVDKGQTLGGNFLKENYFVVVVSDAGYGIPQGEQAKVFTKFFRADNAREKQVNGTGLGLYIVKSILDNSGGLIWFTSQENKGSVFYVAIPTTGMRAKVAI